MKRLAMFVVVIIALAVSTVSAQWFRVELPGPPSGFNDIIFSDTLNGWAVGNNKIVKSTNGGRDWADVASLPSGIYDYVTIHIEGETVWVAGSSGFGSGPGILASTTTNGNSWNTISHPAGNSRWWDMKHFGSKLVVAGGYWMNSWDQYGLLLYSTDKGVSWQLIQFPQYGGLRSIAVVNDSVAWIAGLKGTLIKTTDGGNTWIDHAIVNDTSVNHNFLSFSPSGQTGYLEWSNGVTWEYGGYRTTDGGASWLPYTPKPSYLPRDAIVINDQVAYVAVGLGSENQIMKTTDAGETFQPSSIGYDSDFLRACFIDERHMWFVGQFHVYYYDYQTQNNSPNFVGPLPPTTATVGEPYDVVVMAEDVDNDTLAFTLLEKPGFLSFLIELESSILTAHFVGTPTMADTGFHPISVMVEDGRGGSDTLSWVLHVEVPVPVELTTFSAVAIEGKVYLSWITATELNNSGFEIERQAVGQAYTTVAFVPGHGTTPVPHYYSFVDNSALSGIYLYRLKQVDFDGTYEYSDSFAVTVGAPLEFSLSQNYPNPFNPVTVISYQIPNTTHVRLVVYDLVGQEVAILVNEELPPGSYTAEFIGQNLPSGTYFYQLQAGPFTKTNKMVLTK
ncbi:MAG: YCF48-related protein [Candidatus Veblenbacteria bacterium]|nr:YCF48-related protein [Candidatus Veblenbacteria bacterium]